MTSTGTFLAFDLGAESGRAMLGRLRGDRLSLSEVYRFPNRPVQLPDGLHWDVLYLWAEIKQALVAADHQSDSPLSALGLDSWGVDFGLLDRSGALIANPFHYRDGRTNGMMERAFAKMPRDEIFAHTGVQFMQLNSLYQLLAMVSSDSPVLQIAHTFLTIPDLFNYWLTGRKACEFTNATTTQCCDPRGEQWALPLLTRLGIPLHIFPAIVQPGTVLGRLTQAVATETGVPAIPVIAPACHDTGSAVAAVPASTVNYAWISSGTWSIMGAETLYPVINDQALAFNFTNEGGVDGTYRFSKNVMGLWLVQECRRIWSGQGAEHSYDELITLAGQAPALISVMDPDYAGFLPPGDMPDRIRTYCRRVGQPVPENKGATVRAILESLALKYRWVLERLEECLGRRLEVIHVVGGGSQNRLLNQFTADATGRQVIAGPVEATAAGNVLMQAATLGDFSSPDDLRQVVRNSFPVRRYDPAAGTAWDDAYEKLVTLMGNEAP